MAQVFRRYTNTLSRFSLIGAACVILFFALFGAVLVRSPYFTKVGVAREQPIPFSHDHHVTGLGIDCRFCHNMVEKSASAGMPSTETCMACHSQVWNKSPMLEPVRQSFRTGKPIEWTRVHDLPDFVSFDHSIHVKKGIGCASCHGDVGKMPLMWREKTLHMEWCLSCHRSPQEFVQPKNTLFRTDVTPQSVPVEERVKLAKELKVQKMTDCSVCHR